MQEKTWDAECDVLVVGGGGGALTGAYVAANEGLRTIVVESTDKWGGTTSYSGGGVWLPANQASARMGIEDTSDIALEYFHNVVGDRTPFALQEAFVRTGPEVVAYLEENPFLPFEWGPFPDYYSDRGVPPGRADGRIIFMLPLAREEVGELSDRLRYELATDFYGAKAENPLTGGRVMIARLLLAVQATGNAELRLNTAMDKLVLDGDRVVGIEADANGQRIRIKATRGVLLAAGGFERNQEMREAYGVDGKAAWSAGGPGGTGKVHRAAMEIGAATDLMEECWWMPALLQPDNRPSGFIAGINGGLMVNAAGKRFANESLPYDRWGREVREAQKTGISHIPAWWIWDASLGPKIPSFYTSAPVLEPEEYLRAGLWHSGETLTELASKIGVPADALEATVERFNGFAETGVDEDFHRGEAPYDYFIAVLRDQYGSPNACLMPLKEGPYYAAAIGLGDLGTKGGLKTDASARVLDGSGTPIPGLYAAGQTMASAAGHAYPAPGTPIGNSMVFSYLAARDMLRQSGSDPAC